MPAWGGTCLPPWPGPPSSPTWARSHASEGAACEPAGEGVSPARRGERCTPPSLAKRGADSERQMGGRPGVVQTTLTSALVPSLGGEQQVTEAREHQQLQLQGGEGGECPHGPPPPLVLDAAGVCGRCPEGACGPQDKCVGFSLRYTGPSPALPLGICMASVSSPRVGAPVLWEVYR